MTFKFNDSDNLNFEKNNPLNKLNKKNNKIDFLKKGHDGRSEYKKNDINQFEKLQKKIIKRDVNSENIFIQQENIRDHSLFKDMFPHNKNGVLKKRPSIKYHINENDPVTKKFISIEELINQPKKKVVGAYEEPKILPGGDQYLLIEFGNRMNLELNFKAQGIASEIKRQKVRGVHETLPCFASLLIHYEPDIIGFEDLKREILKLIEDSGDFSDIEVPSRLFRFPTVYLDKWTKEAIDDYREKIKDKQYDPEFIVDLNKLEDVDQFVRVHSGTEYWVSSIGFWPGLPFTMPLDPRRRLTAPKYNPPRTWTPKGTVGMGGSSTCIYPDRLPGGYQIFGRTPVPIWDTENRFPEFENSIVLFRPGDRIKFDPCSYEEFEMIERKINEGNYKFNLIRDETFSISRYNKWVDQLDKNERL